MLRNLTALLACQLAGEIIVRAAGLPVPGPVAGMALLFCGLVARGASEGLAGTANGLLNHLALLFVPAGVGVVDHLGLIEDEWRPIAGALLVSTLVTIAVTGALLQRLLATGMDDAR